MKMTKSIPTSFAILLLATTCWGAQGSSGGHVPDARMLRFPDVSADKIVFSYADDLWTVAKEGGVASRLSSPKGQEYFPKFSPDGTMIAFSGNYDGNVDVYIVSAEGGVPKRLTHHPGEDIVVEWYPDGKHILYRSRMVSPSIRFNRFFKQSIDGGLPQTLPLPYGELASFSPDGSRIAFEFVSSEARTWKRYRGGMATDVWLYDFLNNSSEKITDYPGTDAVPMWHENTIYFLSDRGQDQKLNIWAYDLRARQTHQVTKFNEYDVEWPSIGPNAIVFQNGGTLHLLDFVTEISRPLDIRVPDDLPEIRTELKDVSKLIRNYAISPTGKRAVFEARGEIFTVPEKNGSVRDLTNTSGAAERDPAWSPDGRWVAYFSDRTGEYELYLHPSDGKGEPNQITKDSATFRYTPVWSPDSKKIAFSDKTGSLFTIDIKTRDVRFVDKDPWQLMESYSWSPDSRWLAYSKQGPNHHGVIMIYDANEGAVHQVTSDYYMNTNPVFDANGQYLFFASNRAFNPVYGDIDTTWVYPNATKLYAATLAKNCPSPLAPRSDEEEVKEEKPKAADPNSAKAKDEKGKEDANEPGVKPEKAVPPVKVDFDGFEQRVVELPIPAGNFGSIHPVKDKLVFLRQAAAGAAKPDEPSGTLRYYDLKEREEKTVIDTIDDYCISADRKKVLYRSRSTYGVVDLAENKKVGDGKIAADNLKAWINPPQEWHQIFTEAWRIERDFFYDPNMHGVDWTAMKKRYEALLPYVVDREDLNYVIGELIGELNSSHTYVSGGDIEEARKLPVGLLGCDFELDRKNNAYRISKIYRGANWDVEARSPLTEPGIDVREGDYLLSVNGRPLDVNEDPWAAFQGLAGEVVRLTISHKGDPNDTNDVVVKPTPSEFRLRNLAWIESNRAKVEKATQGRVGYVYVPDTSLNGQNELVRQFTPQWIKEAWIVDERFNGGGQIPDRFIELLNRPILNYWARRDHHDWQTPAIPSAGPKVMIINGWSGSGGDAFPYYFREAHLGPLVGMRTWGGLIGISGNPQPIDGGFISAPSFAFYHDGKWGIEGYGVDPDYEVENLPHEMVAGRDAQLDTAVAVALKALEKEPPVPPQRPAYPDRSPIMK